MSDNDKPDTGAVPAWLAGGGLQPVAPVSSEAANCPHGSPLDAHGNAPLCSACVGQHIAAEIPGELLGMLDSGGDLEPGREAEAKDIEVIAEKLIAFKRFWQWPAGTRDELVAAKECASLLVELTRNGDQS